MAVDGRQAMGADDAEGHFIRDTCGFRLAGAGGNIVCFTAAGTRLGWIEGANGQQCDPLRAWDQWQELPESERQPGAVRVEERGLQDPKIVRPSPPPGGLILKQFYRMLAADAEGQLRHVIIDDFDYHERLSAYRDPSEKRHFFEAAPDFVWLTAAEWQSLLPADPRPGDHWTAPASIAQRIFRFHLVPDITFGESNGWSADQVRGGDLTLTVEDAATSRVRLRLEGFARLGLDYETALARSTNGGHSAHGYEPHLLGFLEYDPRSRVIEQFDLVALGDFYGALYGDNRWLYRSGRTPLGVSFELVTADFPAADRQVPPRAARFPESYFSAGKDAP